MTRLTWYLSRNNWCHLQNKFHYRISFFSSINLYCLSFLLFLFLCICFEILHDQWNEKSHLNKLWIWRFCNLDVFHIIDFIRYIFDLLLPIIEISLANLIMSIMNVILWDWNPLLTFHKVSVKVKLPIIWRKK